MRKPLKGYLSRKVSFYPLLKGVIITLNSISFKKAKSRRGVLPKRVTEVGYFLRSSTNRGPGLSSSKGSCCQKESWRGEEARRGVPKDEEEAWMSGRFFL